MFLVRSIFLVLRLFFLLCVVPPPTPMKHYFLLESLCYCCAMFRLVGESFRPFLVSKCVSVVNERSLVTSFFRLLLPSTRLQMKLATMPPAITRSELQQLVEDRPLSIARARKDLGYEPRWGMALKKNRSYPCCCCCC